MRGGAVELYANEGGAVELYANEEGGSRAVC